MDCNIDVSYRGCDLIIHLRCFIHVQLMSIYCQNTFLMFWSVQTQIKIRFRIRTSETIANAVASLSYTGDDGNIRQSLIDVITPEEVSTRL